LYESVVAVSSTIASGRRLLDPQHVVAHVGGSSYRREPSSVVLPERVEITVL
jgi:hypothetical protein